MSLRILKGYARSTLNVDAFMKDVVQQVQSAHIKK